MGDFNGVGVDVGELRYEGKLVGHRILITYLGDIAKVFARVDMHLDPKLKSTLERCKEQGLVVRPAGKAREGKFNERTGTICFGNDQYFIELQEAKSLIPMLKLAAGANEKLSKIKDNFESIICNKILLKLSEQGIEIPSSRDERFNASELQYSGRFIGGFGAWSGGDGDICDADKVSNRVTKALKEIIDIFNKDNGTGAYFQVGEKAWIYIFIE